MKVKNKLEGQTKLKPKQKDIDKLADELNANWWKKNKKHFIN